MRPIVVSSINLLIDGVDKLSITFSFIRIHKMIFNQTQTRA